MLNNNTDAPCRKDLPTFPLECGHFSPFHVGKYSHPMEHLGNDPHFTTIQCTTDHLGKPRPSLGLPASVTSFFESSCFGTSESYTKG